MTFAQDIDRMTSQKTLWRNGFDDPVLEGKRRSAIIWLRMVSKKGWVLDKVIRK